MLLLPPGLEVSLHICPVEGEGAFFFFPRQGDPKSCCEIPGTAPRFHRAPMAAAPAVNVNFPSRALPGALGELQSPEPCPSALQLISSVADLFPLGPFNAIKTAKKLWDCTGEKWRQKLFRCALLVPEQKQDCPGAALGAGWDFPQKGIPS